MLEELKNGDVITYANGKKGIFMDGIILGCFHLGNFHEAGRLSEKDIVRIERPVAFNRIYGDILTPNERDYLSAVIRPFRDRVQYITKVKYNDGKCFIRISIDKDNDIDLPSFDESTMYTGLGRSYYYTLGELGL